MKCDCSKTVYFLVLLIEECAEVIQRACKAIRFGMDDKEPGQPLNNRNRLQQEMVDRNAVEELMVENGIIQPSHTIPGKNAKKEKVKKYLAYSFQLGTVHEDYDGSYLRGGSKIIP